MCAFIPPIPTNHYQTLPNSGSPKPRSPGSPPPSPEGSSLSLFLSLFLLFPLLSSFQALSRCLSLARLLLSSLSLFILHLTSIPLSDRWSASGPSRNSDRRLTLIRFTFISPGLEILNHPNKRSSIWSTALPPSSSLPSPATSRPLTMP